MRFLLIYPPIGATLAMSPHVRAAIEECGHQVEIFDFSKIMPLALSRSKTRDLAWDVAEELLIKKALEVKPDIFLDFMPCDKKTIRRLKEKKSPLITPPVRRFPPFSAYAMVSTCRYLRSLPSDVTSG